MGRAQVDEAETDRTMTEATKDGMYELHRQLKLLREQQRRTRDGAIASFDKFAVSFQAQYDSLAASSTPTLTVLGVASPWYKTRHIHSKKQRGAIISFPPGWPKPFPCAVADPLPSASDDMADLDEFVYGLHR